MAINYWRYKDYSDDGCSIYQCLKCYGEWEMRGSPGYQYEEKYHPTWHFCPICGTQWLGMRLTGTPNDMDRQLGPRRAKIAAAIERMRREDFTGYYERRDRIRNQVPFWWVIQKMEEHDWQRQSSHYKPEWEPAYKARGLTIPAAIMLKHAREEYVRLDREGDHHRKEYDLDGEITFKRERYTVKVRLVLLKKEPSCSEIHHRP